MKAAEEENEPNKAIKKTSLDSSTNNSLDNFKLSGNAVKQALSASVANSNISNGSIKSKEKAKTPGAAAFA